MENNKLQNEDDKPIQFFDKKFVVSIGIIVFIFLIICFFPKWFVKPATSSFLDFSSTGQIGDTIGGIMGPFVAICAAILTFLAFWIQYKANQQQARQFKVQAKDARIDRFENRLSELIKIHRDNLNEIEVAGISGRKAFIDMFNELRFVYYCVKDHFNSTVDKNSNIIFLKDDGASLLDIAYRVFYLGIGPKSDKLLFITLTDRLSNHQIQDLLNSISQYKNLSRLNKPLVVNNIPFKLAYTPLDGHISKLGHYFRHLYHVIKFIAEQDSNFIKEDQKYNYAKTVRAQLSDHEQLLLFYNINSIFGKPWIQDGYLRRFRIIKNLPVPLADFGVLPAEIFKDDIKYWLDRGQCFFQWDE